MKPNLPLRIIEVLVLGGIVTAFLLPVIVPSQSNDNAPSSTRVFLWMQANLR